MAKLEIKFAKKAGFTNKNTFVYVQVSSRAVPAPNCGVRGPSFKSHCGRLCLLRQLLQCTDLGMGCAPLLQCVGRLSLPPSWGTVKWVPAYGLSNNIRGDGWWMWMVAGNFRQTHNQSRLAWFEGWRPPGAQSTFIRLTGWTLTVTLVTMIARKHCRGYCCYYYYFVQVPSVLWVLLRCWLCGRKGIWPVKNCVVGCWHGYLSGARCRLAYGPADATASCFWYRLTR